MDMVVVAVMAVAMIGAAIWCWCIENLSDADQKNRKKSDHSENGAEPLESELCSDGLCVGTKVSSRQAGSLLSTSKGGY